MDRQKAARCLVILGTLAVLVAPALAADTPALAWAIDADGNRGRLELRTGPDGTVEGTLFGRPVEGWLAGRHLLLAREGENGRETWEAWLGTGTADTGQAILAGTFILPGDTAPRPWYGTPAVPEPTRRPASPEPRTPAPVQPGTAAASRPSPIPPSPSGGETAPPKAGLRLPNGQPAIAGTWETPDGPMEIRQEGSRLTFVSPEGEVSGRLTGPDTLIGGFGPGCCKGTLEQGFTVIAWENGVRWFRK